MEGRKGFHSAERVAGAEAIRQCRLSREPGNQCVLCQRRFGSEVQSGEGEDDQAAGLVWRANDARSYYVVRANALEGNVRIYKFVDGKRTQFGGVKKDVADNRWHTLKIEAAGAIFKVWLNGEELFTAEDKTFPEPGAIGLWTKADSETLFDDFNVLSR